MSAHPTLSLLLVEDHLALREMLTESLQENGHAVHAFESAEAVLADIDKCQIDIAILDLNLPGEDGLYLAERLRRQLPGLAIIMLTVRNAVADKLAGYESGADIYLPKPVVPEELNAAIKALSRRIGPKQTADIQFNATRGELTNTRNQSVSLTEEETRLLIALAQAPHNKLEFWQLAETLQLDLDSLSLRTNLEKRISRLRQKLAQLEQPATAIKAIRGFGYRLIEP